MTRNPLATFFLACAVAASLRATTPPPAPPPNAPERSPVVTQDVYALPVLTDLAVSPDAARAVLVEQRADREADVFRGRLFTIDLVAPESAPRPLTAAHRDAAQPRFSPDGRYLAWIESGEAKNALRVAPARGGRTRTIVELREEIAGFDWSPDGERLVFVRQDPEPAGAAEHRPWVVTRSQARKDGEGFLGERRSHLWVVERSGGAPRRLTGGPWDDASPAWSPDGRSIAFVSNRAPDPDATDNTDLFLIAPEGGEPRRLFAGPGTESAPAWSRRGDGIAVHSLRRADDYSQPQRVMTLAAAGGAATDLTGRLDAWVAADALAWREPHPPIWSPDDATLTVVLERCGATWIAEVDARSGAERELFGGRAVYGLARPLPGGRLLFTRGDATHPPELFLAGGGGERRLTHLYDAWLARRRLAEPEKISATNSAGDQVEAWLYPPLDRKPGERAPLILYIHGGPQDFDGDFFDFDLENQLFPAAGWAVLRVNYRGSTSYGEAFSRAIWADWHRREYEDLMLALDHALATHAWLDPERLGIGGWSYGGIMTLWTVGHTDRFRVGVPERFSFDYLSTFGEDQWYVWLLTELGSPFENPELYRRLSPGTYLPQVTTPLYLIANENDYNCPLTQVLQAYQRLRLLGQNTELVVYPGESHSMESPAHLVDRLERLLVWYSRHLEKSGAAPAP